MRDFRCLGAAICPAVIPAKAGIHSGRPTRLALGANRRTAALILAALVVLALPSAAAAHGGSLVFSGDRGPYQIRAFAILNEGWLDYSIDLRELGSGERVTDAQVSVVALTPDGLLGPWDALYTGTVYEMIERAPDDVDWTMQVDVTGGPGPITYAHRLRITPGTWIWPTVAVGLVFALAVVAHAYTGRKRRTRARNRQERAPAR